MSQGLHQRKINKRESLKRESLRISLYQGSNNFSLQRKTISRIDEVMEKEMKNDLKSQKVDVFIFNQSKDIYSQMKEIHIFYEKIRQFRKEALI